MISSFMKLSKSTHSNSLMREVSAAGLTKKLLGCADDSATPRHLVDRFQLFEGQIGQTKGLNFIECTADYIQFYFARQAAKL